MGYTTASTSMFSPEIKQTPEAIRKVLDIAGWTPEEAAREIALGREDLRKMMEGDFPFPMSPAKWRLLLDKAGRRSFDHDEDSLE